MYDHNKKAGNQGDVIKHVALVAALEHMLTSGHGPFVYCDAFSGYAVNPLTKSGEWRYGIGHLAKREATSPNDHVRLWQRFWSTGIPLNTSTYPGSSSFALRLAMLRGRPISMHLWDISPGVVYQLMAVYEGLLVTIHPTAAAPGDIPAADFLLVDPPGVGPANDYPTLEALLDLCATTDAFLLWLPMVADIGTKQPLESAASQSWRQTAAGQGYSTTAVRWTSSGPVCGCQLVYRLPGPARLALTAGVDAVVDATEWATRQVTHSDPPRCVA